MVPIRDEQYSRIIVRSGKVVSAAEQTHNHDVRVSIILLLVLIAAALQIPLSGEIGEDSVHRHGFFMHVLDLIVNCGLSIGMSLVLFSSRLRSGRDGASR